MYYHLWLEHLPLNIDKRRAIAALVGCALRQRMLLAKYFVTNQPTATRV
ncbi:MAG: hypothetical protein AB4426_30595 [Xenococcaceae cyanobacterium]